MTGEITANGVRFRALLSLSPADPAGVAPCVGVIHLLLKEIRRELIQYKKLLFPAVIKCQLMRYRNVQAMYRIATLQDYCWALRELVSSCDIAVQKSRGGDVTALSPEHSTHADPSAGHGRPEPGIAVFDRDLRLVAWTGGFEKLASGPHHAARVGARLKDFAHVRASLDGSDRDDLGPVLSELARAAERGEAHSVDWARSGGSVIRVSTSPLSAGGCVATFADVTGETRGNAAMATQAKLDKMDALARMASGISYDFNNLLTSILGNLVPLSERMRDRELVEEFLTPSISAARRGALLTQRLLSFARREPSDPERTDIGEAIAEICKSLGSQLPGALQVIHREGEGDLTAMVDRARLEAALLDLAKNAGDATGGKGRLTIETLACDLPPDRADLMRLAPGRYVKITVSDDGCGMSTLQVERVFEPFYSSRAAGSGFGLGLSMVYGFVRQSNGAISVASKPGGGTTFTILLPGLSVKQAPKNDAALADGARADSTEFKDRRIAPIILLVDKDPDIRRKKRRKIAGLGYPLMEAEDAEEALRLLQQVKGISFVVSDLETPGPGDAYGLAASVRAVAPHVDVILMTDKASPPTSGDPRIQFLRKPLGVEELAAALDLAAAERGRAALSSRGGES